MRIFITGATGMIGRRLAAALTGRGDQVVALSRNADRARAVLGNGVQIVEGDPTVFGPWIERVDQLDGVVNLVGERVLGGKWTGRQKERLRRSRIDATRNLVRAIAESPRGPSVLVSGSAVGYYGFHDDEVLTEESAAGDDFLARLCIEWEHAALEAKASALRVVLLRTGVVLDPDEGALAQMLPPFRWFVGGPVGNGRQWLSWIHRDDLAGMILFALDHADVSGPINATSPEPQTNREFSKTLASVLGRPCLFRVPGLALRLRYGSGAELITKGQRVLPARAEALGYAFRYPQLRGALEELLSG